jgi:cullin-associated NEDD8-dissociated protein 1
VRKVAEARAEELVRNLCDKAVTVVAKKEQARDIASIGLKTIIAEIPGGHLAQNAATTITNKMLDAAAKVRRLSGNEMEMSSPS